MASVETANVEMFHHERERCGKKLEKTDLLSQQTCHGTVVNCHDYAHTRMLLRRKAV